LLDRKRNVTVRVAVNLELPLAVDLEALLLALDSLSAPLRLSPEGSGLGQPEMAVTWLVNPYLSYRLVVVSVLLLTYS